MTMSLEVKPCPPNSSQGHAPFSYTNHPTKYCKLTFITIAQPSKLWIKDANAASPHRTLMQDTQQSINISQTRLTATSLWSGVMQVMCTSPKYYRQCIITTFRYSIWWCQNNKRAVCDCLTDVLKQKVPYHAITIYFDSMYHYWKKFQNFEKIKWLVNILVDLVRPDGRIVYI